MALGSPRSSCFACRTTFSREHRWRATQTGFIAVILQLVLTYLHLRGAVLWRATPEEPPCYQSVAPPGRDAACSSLPLLEGGFGGPAEPETLTVGLKVTLDLFHQAEVNHCVCVSVLVC